MRTRLLTSLVGLSLLAPVSALASTPVMGARPNPAATRADVTGQDKDANSSSGGATAVYTRLRSQDERRFQRDGYLPGQKTYSGEVQDVRSKMVRIREDLSQKTVTVNAQSLKFKDRLHKGDQIRVTVIPQAGELLALSLERAVK